MGYFPNGTAGDLYYSQYCDRCLHESDGRQCSVWLAHLLYNYDQCNDEKSILHVLIPRDQDGWNQQCTMFLEDPHHDQEKLPLDFET